jgi:1,4-alpha-glucan branching enzyme
MNMSAGQSLLTEDDLFYFNEGRFFRLYDKLGAHVLADGGVHFAVWAPNARSVSVIGDFNYWDRERHSLHPVGTSGIWAGSVPDAQIGQAYKYFIQSRNHDYSVEKADPVAFCAETPPHTASVIWNLAYEWQDQEWMKTRSQRQTLESPISIYEVHLGSWRRKVEEGNRPLSYSELADELVRYVRERDYTHVEFMPVMEHPFGGSWGYQVTGYFAPTRRYGNPQELMFLIDRMHQAGIGVILDWVPSHFPGDEHGLAYFDGTHLYEHADPRQGFHPDWQSYIFNYGRQEVRSFLISSAMFWLDKYHADGLRVDAVASMLYLDYSRKQGEWVPNPAGGRENLDAILFMRTLNEAVYGNFPGIQMIAEESTSWPMVSRPTNIGGLGYGLKWDMGWMHDTLRYFRQDSIHRKYHQNELTFRSIYAFHENFVLSFSHDEVVHGKGSMINKMPGDDWQKFANLRCLYTYMYAIPGKKLNFMGNEFAQWNEWNHDSSLEWHLSCFDRHSQVMQLVTDLNRLYKYEPSLHIDCDPSGFEWVDASDAQQSVLSFLRKGKDGSLMLCVFNFTPIPRDDYWIGVPQAGNWEIVFNSDYPGYGGCGYTQNSGAEAVAAFQHGRPYALKIPLPPLGGMMLKWNP